MSNKRPPYHTIVKVFKNHASDAERALVDSWLAGSERNESEYQKLQAIWAKYGKHHESYHVNSDIKAQGLLDKNVRERNSRKTLFKIAAAITLLFVTGIIVYQLTSYRKKTDQVYASTSDGQEVTLPDGSLVVMRAGSKIVLEDNFDQQTRGLVLEGEAYFEVTENKQKPFIVNSGVLTVEVLGTSFLVTPFAERTEVALFTGKVDVHQADQQLSLLPNETAIFKKTLTKKEGVGFNLLSWKTQQIVFQDEKLTEVLKVLSSHFKVKIEASKTIGELRLTASFKDQTIDEILLIISNIHHLEIQNKNKVHYYLKQK